MDNKYISPGVYVQEREISFVKHPKRYSRRIKIGKIFGIDVPNVIISKPNGPTNFPQHITSSNFSDFF
jgi:hypothetical protein